VAQLGARQLTLELVDLRVELIEVAPGAPRHGEFGARLPALELQVHRFTTDPVVHGGDYATAAHGADVRRRTAIDGRLRSGHDHPMKMIALTMLPLVAAVACAAPDDDWVVRPPGGGTGSSGQQVDAARPDGGDLDGGTGDLTGVVCVVADLRAPDACPAVAAAAGVLVRALGDPTGATSDASGRFTLAAAGAVVILDVGSGAATLTRAVVPVANAGAVVHAPVPTRAAWDATVAATGTVVAPGNGAIALYVDTSVGTPAAGVTLDLPAGGVTGPFYDRSGGAWTAGGGTGPAGVALVLDLPPGSYQLDGGDGAGHTVSLSGVPVAADALTFIRGRLSP
jgi:hypothetical protein